MSKKVKTAKAYLDKLKDLEKKLREKGKIDFADQTEIDNEDLSKEINEAISIFSEMGYLNEVAEVCKTISSIFSIAALKSKDEEFSRRAERIAKVWSERAKFEKASIGLVPDLIVTAEIFRLSEEAQKAIEKGIEWLKQSRKATGGWGWVPEKIFKEKHYLSKLKDDPYLTRAWDTAMAIRALLTVEEKPDQEMILEAINWLKQNRNNDGSWGLLPPTYPKQFITNRETRSNTPDTSCVIIALLDARKYLDIIPELISKGVNLLMDSETELSWLSPVWCEYLGEKRSEDNPPTRKATSMALVALLKADKRPSFGDFVNKRPWDSWDLVPSRIEVEETSYMVIALSEGNEGADARYKSIGWFKLVQNADGGWGLTKDDKESEIESTALAITALLRAGESSKDITVRNGVKWLLSKQVNDNWGSDTPLVILTLHDFIAKQL